MNAEGVGEKGGSFQDTWASRRPSPEWRPISVTQSIVSQLLLVMPKVLYPHPISLKHIPSHLC